MCELAVTAEAPRKARDHSRGMGGETIPAGMECIILSYLTW